MKGFAHFASGICAATFFPDLVGAGSAHAYLIALGGAAALLPDFLDFRITRYLERLDDEIELGINEQELDPQGMADRIAENMNAVLADGKPRTIQLHALQIAPDRWQRYSVHFPPDTGKIVVSVGPVVDSGNGVESRTAQDEGNASIEETICAAYGEKITVDIFSGPSLRIERIGPHAQSGSKNDGQPVERPPGIRVVFLPWHRRWSHSLVVALLCGALGLVLKNWQLAIVVFLGMAIHSLEDQLGYLGCNLFWPLTRKRWAGFRLFHSDDPIANSLTVLAAALLSLWNIDRYSQAPQLNGTGIVVAIGLAFLIGTLYKMWEQRGKHTRRIND